LAQYSAIADAKSNIMGMLIRGTSTSSRLVIVNPAALFVNTTGSFNTATGVGTLLTNKIVVCHANLLPYKLQTFPGTIVNSLNQESILIFLWGVPKCITSRDKKTLK